MAAGAGDARVKGLATLVRRTRGSLVATVLAAGLLLATAIALAWVVGGVLLDLATPLSVAGRQAVWCGWWAAVATAVGLFLVVPAMRWPLLDAVALRIERSIGDVHNQLLTVVDLARRTGSHTQVLGPDGRVLRPDMVERLLDQSQQRVRGFRASRVLPWRTLVRNLAIAVAVVTALAGLHVGLGERFRITLARLLDPAADIPPATWLQLRSPGDLDVLEGDPLEIRAAVVRGEAADVSLALFAADGRASRQPMRLDADGTFVARLEGLDQPVRYRLESGSAWTRTHAIGILERPEIRSLSCRVRLPDYMRIDQPLDVAADATRVEPPEGSTVEFALAASGDTASGSLGLFERSLSREVVERHDDRVWFEDDLPRDAVADPPWRWTTAQAAGGLRSFVVSGDRPVALRTRLEPLVMPRERPDSRAFSLMGRGDPGDPPTRLTVVLEHGQASTELVWGVAETSKPPPHTSRIAAGPLPTAGDWTRLTVPLESLRQIAGQPVSGATFTIDRGRMLLDRPGWTERSEEVVSRPIDRPTGTISLVRTAAEPPTAASGRADTDGPRPGRAELQTPNAPSPADGLWKAVVPVEKPIWVTPTLLSRHGHSSLPKPPLEIAPTTDRPPSIVVDASADAMLLNMVLKAAIDVPITGSGFDDWGIDEICVLAGPDPARLDVRQTLPGAAATDRPPRTQLAIATTLSPETLGLVAGKSTFWKLRITDTKGQVTETDVFRITVQPPPESDLARAELPALAQARREAVQLAREAEKKADATDAKRREIAEAVEANAAPPRRLVDELAARTERERRLADQVARSVAKAADQASRSRIVPQAEKEALAQLASEARMLERRLAGSPPDANARSPHDEDRTSDTSTPADKVSDKSSGKASDKAPVAAPDTHSPETKKSEKQADKSPEQKPAQTADGQSPSPQQADKPQTDAASLTPQQETQTPRQRAEAAKARQVAEAPTQSAVTEAAQALAQALEQVEERLAAQGAALQIDALAEDLSRRAQKLTDQPHAEQSTEQARQAVRDVEQILGARFEGARLQQARPAEPSKGGAPQAPADTASKADASRPAAQAARSDADTKNDPPRREDAAPQAMAASVEEADQQDAAKPTPAEAAAKAAQAAAEAAVDLAARLTSRPAGGEARPATAESARADDRPHELKHMLAGDEVRQALAMAERARRLQAREAAAAEAAARAAARAASGRGEAARDRDGRQARATAAATDEEGASEGGAMAGSTAIAPADAMRGLDARQRAALYKLPPHIRDPLLDGMRQRGPEAYQGVIDSYFRQLGRDIPQ